MRITLRWRESGIAQLAPIATWICASADRCDLEASGFDLIHAALLLEYIEPSTVLPRVVGWLAPGGVFSVVLQLPGGDGRISATGFASLQTLSGLMRLVDPDALRELATRVGLVELSSREVPLARGKAFWAATFGRPGGCRSAPQARCATIVFQVAAIARFARGRLVAPRRRRGVRLSFFQVAAIARFARGRLVASVRLLRSREGWRRRRSRCDRLGERQLPPVLALQEQQVHRRVDRDDRRRTDTRSSAARTRSCATSGTPESRAAPS